MTIQTLAAGQGVAVDQNGTTLKVYHLPNATTAGQYRITFSSNGQEMKDTSTLGLDRTQQKPLSITVHQTDGHLARIRNTGTVGFVIELT
jgi:hypothetical protein